MYNEDCQRVECTTNDPLPRPPPARQLSLCSAVFVHPSLVLFCGVLLAVSEDEADDELEEVAILTEKLRSQDRGPHNSQTFDSIL